MPNIKSVYESNWLHSGTLIVIILIVQTAIVISTTEQRIHYTNNGVYNMTGMEYIKLLRQEIKECKKLSNESTWNCFKAHSIRLFDRLLSSEVIPIWHGITMVLMKNVSTANETYNLQDIRRIGNIQHLTWFDNLAVILAKCLTTHMLQVNLKDLTNAYISALDKLDKKNIIDPAGNGPHGTGRHRRHRYNMIITMMFGATALGAVVIPMGFQLLSIISGKALLLAKMALLLASINGLKRVANSGVHYGLYHVPGETYSGGGYYDRGDIHHPRGGIPSLAIAQPIEEIGNWKK